MGKTYESISPELKEWLGRQRVFFVATAPTTPEGHINCSPKGGDTFRVIGPNEVAYQDYTGSGAETVAHLRENGRIVVMFCAFDGPPKIVRLYGRGETVLSNDPRYATLSAHFTPHFSVRAIIVVHVERISDTCGYAVPFMAFEGHRDALAKLSATKGPEGLKKYNAEKNRVSIDGLPAFDA
jgi:predicted pyridoxine 5'-phosphate oxidase superfamily flavin-nucleotide-binding protein